MELLHHRFLHLGSVRRGGEALMQDPATPTFAPSKADWLQAAAVAVLLFVVYAATAPRTVALEDDGLFILSSYFLGIEHPPGYPLFTIIGHAFSRLPFGSVAYRVHLASALFGGLSGAAAWLCARRLGAARLAAHVAALGLGLSPVFWSQAIIAEVYTLNVFFFLVLLYLGLKACPPGSDAPAAGGRRLLAPMAFLFGLSLSNHYPLMLLVAPAFVVLLWPLRDEIVRRFGALLALVVLGLLPYAWLVWRSWQAIPINFDGPLESLPEILFFLSRAGYAGIDHSATAGWLDRIKYFEFETGQLFVQFAVVGTLVALAGFVLQWRTLGRRLSSVLTIAFLMPTAALLLLLGFDYDSIHKHMYHVYPLPAYAVAALWMGLGLEWLARRHALRAAPLAGAAAAVLACIGAAGAYLNLSEDEGWGARYAQTVLKTLPRDAVVFVKGDADLAPIAYFHMIENWRPDITLYQGKGLVLGNRLYHPLRTSDKAADEILSRMVDAQQGPVVFTLDAYTRYARRDRWLYNVVDKSSTDSARVVVDIPDEARRFFDESVAGRNDANAWIAYFQGELRRHYAALLAQSLSRSRPLDERTRRELQGLENDSYGALGIAEGLMLNPEGYSAGMVAGYLERARDAMPYDAPKDHLAGFFQMRGVLRANTGDRAGGIRDLETAISLWPVQQNGALASLKMLYRQDGDRAALEALSEREKHLLRAGH
jgi:Protein of unknown function (DUF2723)